MKKSVILILVVLAIMKTQAQDYLISFTGAGDTSAINYVIVDNLTDGNTLTMNGEDVLHLVGPVGSSLLGNGNHDINIYPNPMADQSVLTFDASESGDAVICIVGLSGKTICQISKFLLAGGHSFQISGVRQGMYFVKISGRNYNYSTKLISQSNLQNEAKIIYNSLVKLSNTHLKSIISTIDMPYTDGDQLLFKGISGIYSTIVTDVPTSSKSIGFNFRKCTDSDGDDYTIVKVGTQTWMAENLNVGQRISGLWNQTNNNTTEKYCYANLESNCDEYGGLYQWNEMMLYDDTPGCQGICPLGWKLPTKEEWATLSTYLGGESNAGGKLKQTGTTHWALPNNGAVNSSGFSALPGGWRDMTGNFIELGHTGSFWAATQMSSSNGYSRYLSSDYESFGIADNDKFKAVSVRCLMCDPLLPVSVTIVASENPAPVGSLVTFSAIPVNGGSDPIYEWKVNGIMASVSQNPVFTYVPAFNDIISCVLISNEECVIGNPATSNAITMNMTALVCPGYPTVEYEGVTYTTVLIGTQCWLAQNLNVGTRIDVYAQQENNGNIEKYCYDNLESNCDIYGGLYQWDELMAYATSSNANPSGRRGICPPGWHVPSKAEWCQMETSLDPAVDCSITGWQVSDLGGKMKEPGTIHWNSPNLGATNESGFTALGAGEKRDYCDFTDLKRATLFWTSFEFSTKYAWHIILLYNSDQFSQNYYTKTYGYSARCVKD